MGRKKKLWMQEAFAGHKEGSLHRQLGVPQKETIPKTLLTEIKGTPVGETAKNPTKTGKRRVKVTGLLKKRAVLAHTAREVRRK